VPGRNRLRGALGVVVDRQLGEGGGLGLEQLGAEEAGLDEHGADPVGRDLVGQAFHPALQAELRRRVRRGERAADDAAGRGDRDHQPGALLAHDREHGACHGHRSEQVGLDLAADLLRRELLEEAAEEVGGVVDQHVDASEPLDRRGDGPLGARFVGDVERGDEQVLVLADGRSHGIGAAAGGDDAVTRGERGPGEVDAHAATGAGDQPRLGGDVVGGHVVLLGRDRRGGRARQRAATASALRTTRCARGSGACDEEAVREARPRARIVSGAGVMAVRASLTCE